MVRIQSVAPPADKASSASIGASIHSRSTSPHGHVVEDSAMDQPVVSDVVQPAQEPVRSHEDVLALIADVERQIARLRTVQTVSAEEIQRHDQRSQEVDAREQALHAADAMLTAREAQLRAMAEAAHAERQRLADRAHDVESQAHAAAEQSALISAERERFMIESRRLADEHAALAALRDELSVRESRAAADAAKDRDELTTTRNRVAAIEAERESVRAAKLTLERDAEAMLERLALASDAAVARDAAIQSLEEELRRAKQTELAQVGALESRIAERTAELDATRQSLQLAGHKLAALAQSVADQAPQLERGAAAMSVASEQERKLRELEQRVRSQAAGADRQAQLEGQLDETRSKVNVLSATITSLETKLHEAELIAAEELGRSEVLATQISETKTVDDSNQRTLESRIEEKSRRFAEVGKLLKKRKERLDQARVLRRAQATRDSQRKREASESAHIGAQEEERLLKRQREELRHVQEMLAASEQRQLSRSIRSRTLIASGWCMFAAAAVAVGSWFAAAAVWPVPSVASVDLVAKLRDGKRITPEAGTAWQAAHQAALKDEAFRSVVQRRLFERGVSTLGGAHQIAAWMDGIHVDSDGPGSIRLVASAPDAETAMIALDTVATTMANESGKLLRGRGDLPKATIAGSAAVPGRVTFSSLVPQTPANDRLQAAGMLFSGVAGLGIAGALVVYGRLARAKRKFDEVGAV